MVSYSKRAIIQRRPKANEPATKPAQTFFLVDTKTRQPLCLTNASSARHLTSATQELLGLAENILLRPAPGQRPLIVAEVEHFTVELWDHVREHKRFDLLVPLRHPQALQDHYRALPPESFIRHGAGLAIATETFHPRRSASSEPYHRYIQRTGERPVDYHFQGFAGTAARTEVPALTKDFPDRWHLEEFFRFDQHLGWKHAGTLNLHIRQGQMAMACSPKRSSTSCANG